MKALFNGMAAETMTETAAVRCWTEAQQVCLELTDGRSVSFPASKYPLLANAPQKLLEKVTLRVDGLALRWEELDEDIWVDDAVCGRFPQPGKSSAKSTGFNSASEAGLVRFYWTHA